MLREPIKLCQISYLFRLPALNSTNFFINACSCFVAQTEKKIGTKDGIQYMQLKLAAFGAVIRSYIQVKNYHYIT